MTIRLALIATLIVTPPCAATGVDIDIGNGVKVVAPKFKEKWSIDDSLSGNKQIKFTCVEYASPYKLTACFTANEFYASIEGFYFLRYGSLPDSKRANYDEHDDASLVYEGGTPPWHYETTAVNVGSFGVHEAPRTLCRTEDNRGGNCYVAAIQSLQTGAPAFAAIVTSEIKNRSNLNEQVAWIHRFLNNLKVETRSNAKQ
ncbi:hypothetical protein [Dyella sp. ASV21]|uniref:hypothetical protein n=1 Tax=Dyella sp. ASV21 TaxID=2795114 RepID=UPI0018ED9C41|nr:hypothetical protein [Dyella sp. ASV21]